MKRHNNIETLYFLQPESCQAQAVKKLIEKNSSKKIVAMLLDQESTYNCSSYNEIIKVKGYHELPMNSVPFGATSTEWMLKYGDIKLNQILMKQDVLSVYEKEQFLELCSKFELPIPKTYLNVVDIHSDDYPIFYKQKYEKGGGTRGIAYNVTDIPIEESPNLIYQEYISSVGTYGVGFIAENGVLKTSFSHFERISYPSSGGSAVIIERVFNERLLSLTKQYLSLSNYSGWGLAEFKWCNKRQDFVFMEINAKFWASCEFTFRNEPKFMELLFDIHNPKEAIKKMIFINRAFNLGFCRGCYLTLANIFAKKIVYPGLIKTILLSLIPQRMKFFLKKFLKKK